MSHDQHEHKPWELRRTEVPGGWIYHGGPLQGSGVYVAEPSQWAYPPNDPRLDQILADLNTLHQELHRMSASQSAANDALTASVAKLSSDFSTFRTDLTAGIADLKAQIAAGGTPDFGPVDAATAKLDTMDTDLAAASAELAAARTPPAAPVA